MDRKHYEELVTRCEAACQDRSDAVERNGISDAHLAMRYHHFVVALVLNPVAHSMVRGMYPNMETVGN